MRTTTRMMTTGAAAIALLGASVTVAEAQVVPRAAAASGVWHCSGAKISRCIEKVAANKVRVNFVNKTNKAVKGRFGLTCQGSSGQRVYELKKNLTARGGYLSGTITCPSGLRDYAFGWQITADTYYSPTIKI
ncbi:hypothetical protein ABZ348_11685 [Streptomyces sp. NPDC005963]|uniref:hypothetical protein n=1 Tax=Streptomyces sp. NPDC005963 TaxID=3156721 RepID=UPI0033C206FF